VADDGTQDLGWGRAGAARAPPLRRSVPRNAATGAPRKRDFWRSIIRHTARVAPSTGIDGAGRDLQCNAMQRAGTKQTELEDGPMRPMRWMGVLWVGGALGLAGCTSSNSSNAADGATEDTGTDATSSDDGGSGVPPDVWTILPCDASFEAGACPECKVYCCRAQDMACGSEPDCDKELKCIQDCATNPPETATVGACQDACKAQYDSGTAAANLACWSANCMMECGGDQ